MNVAPYLVNTWHAAMWSTDLPAHTLVPRTILDEPLVFWRTPDGAVSALEDRCPHRFAPLSMGKLVGDRLQCAARNRQQAPLLIDGRELRTHRR